MIFGFFILVIFDILLYWHILSDISEIERDLETLYNNYIKLFQHISEISIKGEIKNA